MLTTPQAGRSNITEWAKQQACWNCVASLKVDWPKKFKDELITEEEEKEGEVDGVRDQRILKGIEAQTVVVNAGGPLWRTVKEWGVSHKLLTPREADILDVAAAVPNRLAKSQA